MTLDLDLLLVLLNIHDNRVNQDSTAHDSNTKMTILKEGAGAGTFHYILDRNHEGNHVFVVTDLGVP